MNNIIKSTLLMTSGTLFLCFASAFAQAGLIDRGNGLLYDDVLDITWLQDANYAQTSGYDDDGYMYWAEAVAWADSLEYGGYSDWRLPTLSPMNGEFFQSVVFSNNGTTDMGTAHTTTDGSDGGWRNEDGRVVNEMGHMHYVNLARISICVANDAEPATCVLNDEWLALTEYNIDFVDAVSGKTLSIFNLASDVSLSSSYWTGVDFFNNNVVAYGFGFHVGSSQTSNQLNPFQAWAVRDGDVAAVAPIPEPTVLGLLCLGLLSLGIARGKLVRLNLI